MMTILVYSLLVLLSLVFITALVNVLLNRQPAPIAHQPVTDDLSTVTQAKSEREEYFTRLVSSITPTWYWRVNHEYTDFINATINKMTIVQITDISGLFEAQRRCSILNAAVYNYYASLKKRCLDGEQVTYNDIEVLNMRHCFNEFSHQAYPNLVALVWPEFQRPPLLPLVA